MRIKQLRFGLLGAAAMMVLTAAGQCPHEAGTENEKDQGETEVAISTTDVLVFTRRTRVEKSFDIWRMYSNGTGQRRITDTPGVNENKPRLSPDGTRVAYQAGDDIWVMNLDGSGVQNLTEQIQFDRPETGPTWAPEGSSVAFAGSRQNNYDIYTVSVQTPGDPNRIVQAPGDQEHPDLSPDGTQVIFTSKVSDKYWDLGIGPSAGSGALSTLQECTRSLPKCFLQQPRYSHDGTKVAFWRFGTKDDSGLYIMPIGGEPEYTNVLGGILTNPAAWSPDDSEIASISDVDSDIAVRSTSTPITSRDLVSCACRFHEGLDWSEVNPLITIKDASRTEGDAGTSNMRFLVELSGRSDSPVSVDLSTEGRDGGATELIDFDAASGTLTIPAGQTSDYFNVAVRGDTATEANERFHVLLSNPQGGELGRRKAYGKIIDDDKPPPPTPPPPPTAPPAIAYQVAGEMWLMNPDGSDKQKLTNGITPDWKPDGSTVAFSITNDIFEIPAGGGTPTKLNGTANFDGSPSWAPDGSGISWTSLTGGVPDVFKAEPPTGTPQPVAATAAMEFNQDWDVLHDGTEVMAMDKDGAIVFVNPDTGAQIGAPLVPASESADNPAISPDGTKLAYNSNLHGDPDIFVLDLTSPGTPAAHLTTSSANDIAPTWSPDGTKLAFSSNRTGNSEIFTMDAVTGANQTNITNTSEHETEPAWGTPTIPAPRPNAAAPTPETPAPPAPAPAPTATLITPQPAPSPSGSTPDAVPGPDESPSAFTPAPALSGSTAAMIGIPTLLLGSLLWHRRRR